MHLSQLSRYLFERYLNSIPGPPPIIRELSDQQLLSDFRETGLVAEWFERDSREAQVVGNVIRGWIGAELRRRRFALESSQLATL